MKTTFNGNTATRDKWVEKMGACASNGKLLPRQLGQYEPSACFIACGAGKYSTSVLYKKTGIPPRTAKLIEWLFESLHTAQARQFALDTANAIPCGVVLDGVIPTFLNWLMGQLVDKIAQSSDLRAAVEGVATLYANGWPDAAEAQAAEEAAEVAAKAATKAGQPAVWATKNAAIAAARAAWAAEPTWAAWAAYHADELGVDYTQQAEALLGFIQELKPAVEC